MIRTKLLRIERVVLSLICSVVPLALASCLTSDALFMSTSEKPLTQPAAPSVRRIGAPDIFAGHDFSAIDDVALHVPPDAAASMKKLVAYLTEAAHGDLERVRAVFVWEAANIQYDGSAFSVHDIPRLQPEEIFLRKKGVCGHYAVLFERLATLAGIQAQTIVGKATGYPSSILLQNTLHAWNAVKIDGAWYLLDVTWSSGYLDAQFHFHRFSSPVNTDYFLTDPPQFVKTHFPDDPWWQLLPKPIKESDFLVMAAAQLTN